MTSRGDLGEGGFSGGWGGIRTHEGLAPLPVFKTGALNRSATHPQGTELPARALFIANGAGAGTAPITPPDLEAAPTGRERRQCRRVGRCICAMRMATAWLRAPGPLGANKRREKSRRVRVAR